MQKRYLNSPVEKACSMTGLTDDDIRSWSGMEVTEPSCEWAEDGTMTIPEGGFFSPSFSGLDLMHAPLAEIKENTRMGHIALPVPVVNIEYVRGRMPVLPRHLQMPRAEFEAVIHQGKAVATSDFTDEESGQAYRRGEVVPHLPYSRHPDHGLTGAEAAVYLMEQRKVELPGAVLHTLPVLPVPFLGGVCARVEEEGERMVPTDRQSRHLQQSMLGQAFNRVIHQKNRLEKLLALHAPAVILRNEKRRLQERVDSLIRNGAYGYVSVNWYGDVLGDLSHEYLWITGGASTRPHADGFEVPDLPTERIAEVADRYWQAYDHLPEDGSLDEEEAALAPYHQQMELLLSPLTDSVTACFHDSGVDQDRLADIAMHHVECGNRGIDGGFQAAILSMACHHPDHQCEPDFERLADSMMDRIAYYLDNGLAFSGVGTEAEGETA